jgi:hypothetical protein
MQFKRLSFEREDLQTMDRRQSLKLMLAASGSAILSSASVEGQSLHATDEVKSVDRSPSVTTSSEGDLSRKTDTALPVFTWLTLGEVKPTGWIKEQMVRDLEQGFAGCLGDLCHQASSDIFVTHRNTLASKDYGSDDWWNGETEGNWRAGFIMMSYLADNEKTMRKTDDYVHHILSSQEHDGYMGAFDASTRFTQRGELWSQACLLRGLLDYAELTGNADVLNAVSRSHDNSLWLWEDGTSLSGRS